MAAKERQLNLLDENTFTVAKHSVAGMAHISGKCFDHACVLCGYGNGWHTRCVCNGGGVNQQFPGFSSQWRHHGAGSRRDGPDFSKRWRRRYPFDEKTDAARRVDSVVYRTSDRRAFGRFAPSDPVWMGAGCRHHDHAAAYNLIVALGRPFNIASMLLFSVFRGAAIQNAARHQYRRQCDERHRKLFSDLPNENDFHFRLVFYHDRSRMGCQRCRCGNGFIHGNWRDLCGFPTFYQKGFSHAYFLTRQLQA